MVIVEVEEAAVALVMEITGLDVDVGRLDEEGLECSDRWEIWVASAAEEPAGVLGAES